MSNTLLKIVDRWSSGFQIFWSVLLLRYCSTFYINFEHSFQKEIINATNVTIIEPSDGITDGHISVPLLDHRDPWQGIWNAHLKIIMVMIIKIMKSIDHWSRSLLWSSFYQLWLANGDTTPRLYTRQIVMSRLSMWLRWFACISSIWMHLNRWPWCSWQWRWRYKSNATKIPTRSWAIRIQWLVFNTQKLVRPKNAAEDENSVNECEDHHKYKYK